MTFQGSQYSIGDTADTKLQGVTVFDKRGTVLSDLELNITDRRRENLSDRLIHFYNMVQFGYVNQVLTSDKRHLLVYFSNYHRSTFGCSLRIVTGHTERAIALCVGSRHLYYGNIQREKSLTEEFGHFMEVTGDEIDTAVTIRGTGVPFKKVERRMYMRSHFGEEMRRIAEIKHVKNCDILQFLALTMHRLRKTGRSSGSMSEYYFSSELQSLQDSLVCRANTLLVKFLPFHNDLRNMI